MDLKQRISSGPFSVSTDGSSEQRGKQYPAVRTIADAGVEQSLPSVPVLDLQLPPTVSLQFILDSSDTHVNNFQVFYSIQPRSEEGMNRKQNSDQPQYRMNYYPGTVGAPVGYAVAVADKPGLYAASPYAAIPSPYAAGQPGLPPGMQPYATPRQQYAVVSQPSPYTSSQHAAAAAYYASPTATGYTAGGVPLSSLQTMSSSSAQSPYLGTQYTPGIGMQTAMMRPTSVAAGGYGGSPLYAASTYNGLTAVQAQQSRSPYGVAPVGFAAAATLPPSATSPGYPSANAYGGSPY